MSHLMSSLENLEGYEKIAKVAVGTPVIFHIQPGRQRQGRETFPALVLSQHPDDGTLDLIVFLEPEEVIWERRVTPFSDEIPGRSWSHVETIADDEGMEALRSNLNDLADKVFGPFNDPPKSVMEHLADFEARLVAVENSIARLETVATHASAVGGKKGK